MPSDPVELETLREAARQSAHAILQRLSLRQPPYLEWGSPEVLQYLDTEVASAIVTALFEGLFQTDASPHAWVHYEGNIVVNLVSSLGSSFEPDLLSLFAIYYSRYEQISRERTNWINIGDPDWDAQPNLLTLSWQLAWTISRGETTKSLRELKWLQYSSDDLERAALTDLMDDVSRYSTLDSPPLFGGGMGPPDVAAPDISVEDEPEAYREVCVFYGTDRQIDDTKRTYTGDRSDPPLLHYGKCFVSIPKVTKKAE